MTASVTCWVSGADPDPDSDPISVLSQIPSLIPEREEANIMEPMEDLLQSIRGEQIRQGEQIKTLFAQQQELKKLTDSVYRLSAGVEKLTVSVGATEEKLGRLTTDVESIKEKPARRWDTVITVLITAILTAAVSLAVSHI